MGKLWESQGTKRNQKDLAAHEGPSLVWFSLVGGEPISSFTNFSDNDIVSAIMPQI